MQQRLTLNFYFFEQIIIKLGILQDYTVIIQNCYI